MLRQSLKVIAAFWAVLFATVAVAGDGIRLSEWGDGQLTEISGQKAEVVGRDAPELRLGDFLVDEVRSFGAGALDGEQLRKALANRAVGKDGAGIRDWMANRWESAPGRFGAHMAGYAEGRLESLSWVESADVRWTPSADDAFGAFSASGVGGLWTGADSFFGIQPKIQRDNGDGKMSGSFGVFQRRAFGDWAVAGVNAFVDYADDPTYGEFARWSLGADFASPWVDGNAKRYFSNEGRKVRIGDSVFQAYVPDGVSAELRVHSPGLNWLEGYATFAKWEGRGPNADTIRRAYGVSFAPRAGWKVDAETTDGDDFGARVAYAWTLGEESQIAVAEPFGVYSELLTEVDNENFNVLSYELYEIMELNHLYEYYLTGSSYPEAYRTAVSMAWQKVPAYLRVSEDLRAGCLPPVFIFKYDLAAASQIYGISPYGHGSYAGYQWPGDFSLPGHVNPDLPEHHLVKYTHLMARNISDPFRLCDALLHHDGANDLSSKNATPIFMAIYSGSVDKVRYMILAGADVNAENGYGVRPLGRLQRVWNRGNFGGDRDDAEEIARILLANDATCTEKTEGEFCSMEKPNAQAYPKFKPVLPSEGGVLPVEVPQVVFGNPEEVFRITATTDFVDVDFRLMDHKEYLTVTINGTFGNCKGDRCFFNGPYTGPYTIDEADYDRFFVRDGLYEASGETTVAIVSIHSPIPVGTTITGEIEARFSFYSNARNTVTVGFTLAAVAQSQLRKIIFPKHETGTIVHLSTPGLVNERFEKTGGSENIGIESSGAITIFNASEEGETMTLLAESTADNLLGTLQFTVEATIPYDSDAFSRNNSDFWQDFSLKVIEGYSGSLFTVTIHPPYSGLRIWDQTATEGSTLRMLSENIAEILLTTTLTHPEQFIGHIVAESRIHGRGGIALHKSFEISSIPIPPKALATITIYNPGTALTLSVNLSGAEYAVAAGSHPDVEVSSDGVLSVTTPYLTDRTATVVAEATVPGFLGTLPVTAELRTTVSLQRYWNYTVAAGYEGPLFTVTMASAGMSATIDFFYAHEGFTMSAISPAVWVAHGRMLVTNWGDNQERHISGSWIPVVTYNDGDYDESALRLTVSVRPAPTLDVQEFEPNDFGNVVQLPDLVGATGTAVGTAGQLTPGTDGWLRLSPALDFGESATLTVDFTSPNFLGTERWMVTVMVPEFGTPSKEYQDCVRPMLTDIAAKRAESGCSGNAYCRDLDGLLSSIMEKNYFTREGVTEEEEKRMRNELTCELIQKGADPNLFDSNQHPALTQAVGNGYLEVVRILLLAGAKLDYGDDNSVVLNAAAINANAPIGRVLLEKGANVSEINPGSSARAPIHALAQANSITPPANPAEFARLLIKHKVNPNQVDRNGRTYLWHLIQQGGSTESLEVFLRSTVSVRINPNLAFGDAYDGFDQSPLYDAIVKNESAIVDKLLDYAKKTEPQLDVNKRDRASGQVPIHIVRDVEFMRRLVVTLSANVHISRNPYDRYASLNYKNGWWPMDFLVEDDDGSDLYLHLGKIIWDAHDDSYENPQCFGYNEDHRLCKAETYIGL